MPASVNSSEHLPLTSDSIQILSRNSKGVSMGRDDLTKSSVGKSICKSIGSIRMASGVTNQGNAPKAILTGSIMVRFRILHLISLPFVPADHLLDTYLRDWWKEGEGACSENSKLNGMSPMLKYVVICPELPAKNMMWEIGDTQRTVDWAGKQPDGQLTEDDVKLAQSLDYWGLYMSYTLIHELSHNILTCKFHTLWSCSMYPG